MYFREGRIEILFVIFWSLGLYGLWWLGLGEGREKEIDREREIELEKGVIV